MTEPPYIGYYFHNGREQFGSHRKIEAGKTYRVAGKPVLCEHGLHASKRIIDALRYAPSDAKYVCLVELGGAVKLDTDKAVATRRTVLAMADVEIILHEFACWCAEQALKAERKAGREPDERSWAAIRVKRRWLKGQATDEQWEAARAAAREAAWAAQNRKLTAMVRKALRPHTGKLSGMKAG